MSPFRSWHRCGLRALRRGLRSLRPGPLTGGAACYDFGVCGEQVTPVPTTSGFAVLPGHDLSRLADADLIIVLGAAPPTPPPSAALVRQLRNAVARGARSPAPAPARSCWPRRACCWTAGHHPLAVCAAAGQPLPSAGGRGGPQLYIEDGPVVTSAGSAAVIDLCLHLTRREHGAEIADRVARHVGVPPHPRRRTVPVHRDAGRRTRVPATNWLRSCSGPCCTLTSRSPSMPSRLAHRCLRALLRAGSGNEPAPPRARG